MRSGIVILLVMMFLCSTAYAVCLPEDQAAGQCGNAGGGSWPAPADVTYGEGVAAYGSIDNVGCDSGAGVTSCTASVSLGGQRYWVSCVFYDSANQPPACSSGVEDED